MALIVPAKRILIVDDEPHMRRSLADILTAEGYRVDTAGDGLDAVARCEEEDYDTVLLDLRVPGIDGVETFRRLRRRNPALRVVLMSAYEDPAVKRLCLEEGVLAFLSKPLDIDSLLDLIRGVREISVLVVSAELEGTRRLADSLRRQGYWVSVSDSPFDALDLAAQIHFDVILIDVQLPQMNGLDLYLAMKKRAPQAVAVMLSDDAAESEALAREAIRHTAYTLLRKPVDLEQVGSLLTRIGRQMVSHALSKPSL